MNNKKILWIWKEKYASIYFHRPDGCMETAVSQVWQLFYTPGASDYRVISKTGTMWHDI